MLLAGCGCKLQQRFRITRRVSARVDTRFVTCLLGQRRELPFKPPHEWIEPKQTPRNGANHGNRPVPALDVSPFGTLGFQLGVDRWRAFDARSGPIEESDPLAIAPCSFVVAVGSHERLLRRNRRADLRILVRGQVFHQKVDQAPVALQDGQQLRRALARIWRWRLGSGRSRRRGGRGRGEVGEDVRCDPAVKNQ